MKKFFITVAIILGSNSILDAIQSALIPKIQPMSVKEMDKLVANKQDRFPSGTLFQGLLADSSSTVWDFIGPMPILNEGWSNGPASGRVTSILVDPTDPNTVYIGGAQGGIWKSTDQGQTWMPITEGLPSLSTGYITCDPSNPQVIYYGTGEMNFCGDCFYGDGLYRSRDGGGTWEKIATTTYVGSYISKVLIDPTDSLVIHVTCNRGYVRSTDGGNTWYRKISFNKGTDLVMRADSPNVLFAAIYNSGIYKSTDRGETWTQVGGGLPTSGFRRINMAISESNPNIMYASFISDSGTLLGLYKTADGGNTWTMLTNTPNYPGHQGWYDNCIIVDPQDPDVVYAGGVFPYGQDYYGLIKSTDGGQTWIDITYGANGAQLHPDQHALFIGSDGTLWVGNDGGVWKSYDGGNTWINLNDGLGLTQFYTVTTHPTDSNFILGGTQDNGSVRYDGNEAWPQQNTGDGGPSVIEWDSPNIYYTTYILLSVIFKWDNGNYVGDVHGPWDGDRVSWCNAPFIADPNEPNTLLAGTHRVWKSTNSGVSWTNISGDLTYGSGHLRSIAVAIGNSDIIYTGSSDGRIFLTLNGGATWIERYDQRYEGVAITDMCVSPSDWRTLYISLDRPSGTRVMLTSDSGETWSDITGDLPSGLRGMCLAADFRQDPPLLYLGTDYGVYISFDNGSTWQETNGIPDVAVYDISIDSTNDFVLAATHGRGMWRTETATGISEFVVRKKDYFLKVWPNPTVNNLIIATNAVINDKASLTIFSSSGRALYSLSINPSFLQLPMEINTRDFPTGVYFLNLKGKDMDLTKKFTVIKYER